MSDSLFSLGDRIAFHNGVGHDPEWFFGHVTEVAVSDTGGVYRIRWEDGFEDTPGTLDEWYVHDELMPAAKVAPA